MERLSERLALRPAEAAQALGVSPAKLYALVAAGVLPAIKIGGSTRIPAEALAEWVRSKTKAASGTPTDHEQQPA